jgi:CheY-like chemotaxis protein
MPTAELERPCTTAKILVIDDDDDVLAVTRRLLERAGYDVATCSGRFGRLNQVLEHDPDLVLLDVNMPVVSGDDLHALMVDEPALRHVPVVFFSSNDENELRRLARRRGAAGYIPKSSLGSDFSARVSLHLRAAAEAARAR